MVLARIAAVALLGLVSPIVEASIVTVQDEVIIDADFMYNRALQASQPPGIAIASCPPGQEQITLDWTNIDVKEEVNNQRFTFSNGISFQMNIIETAPGFADTWGKDPNGNLKFTAGTVIDANGVIPDGGGTPAYPSGFSTMQLDFDQELEGLYISISDVDSHSTSDAVRIRFQDAGGSSVSTTFATTGTIKTIADYGFEQNKKVPAKNPGWEASLYALAGGPTKTINLDMSVFSFNSNHIGKKKQRSIFPALDFTYCAPPLQPTSAPSESPTPNPSSAPVAVTPSPSSSPVAGSAVTPEPSNSPVAGGVNGDPLIMGLKGQLFKFDGRSGAWYSAISSEAFQWNMRLTRYSGCPDHSDNFVSGAAFTFVDPLSGKVRKLEVKIVNESQVNVGCADHAKNCLGAGSLVMNIDGVETTTGGDYRFADGSGRILAFNTFHQCSRKWFDFDVVAPPAPEEEATSTSRSLFGRRGNRRLANPVEEPSRPMSGVFDVITDLKDTMIDRETCTKWINERMRLGDLFQQPGHYSTIIVQTNDISFHIEYKQEHERCDAHSLDVWISAVSPKIFSQPWEGVIGETKTAPDATKDLYSREEMLKFSDDASYEVSTSFETQCQGCF